MVVIKTGVPLRKVFIKSQSRKAGGSGEEFSEPEFIPVEQRAPEEDERFKEYLEEKLAEARAQWEQETEQKVREAYEKGKEESTSAAEEKISEKVAQLASIIESLKEERQSLLREAETAVVDLSLSIARKFVNTAAVMNSDLIKRTIKSAVKMVTEKDKVVIRINPEDLEEVRAHLDDIIFIGDGIGKLQIRPDKKVDRGGCVVETEAGNIDARIESRFAEIEKALKQAFGNGNQTAEKQGESVEKEK